MEKVQDFSKLLRHPQFLKRSDKHNLTDLPPIHVRLEPTETCNLRCNFCNFHNPDRQRDSGIVPDMANRSIDLRRLETLIHELKQLGTLAVSLTGAGDPLMHPEVEAMLQILVDSKLDIGVTSNLAMNLSDRTIDLLSHVKWIRWSQNAGDDRSFEIIHLPKARAHSFERAKLNAQRIGNHIEFKNTATYFSSSVVLNDLSLNQIERTIMVASAAKCESIQFRPDMIVTRGRPTYYQHKSFDQIAIDVTEQFKERIKIDFNIERTNESDDDIPHEILCRYSNASTYIDPLFNVYPCCYTRPLGAKFILGNVKDQPFSDFWQTNARKDYYRKLSMRDCPSCPHYQENLILSENFDAKAPLSPESDQPHINFV